MAGVAVQAGGSEPCTAVCHGRGVAGVRAGIISGVIPDRCDRRSQNQKTVGSSCCSVGTLAVIETGHPVSDRIIGIEISAGVADGTIATVFGVIDLRGRTVQLIIQQGRTGTMGAGRRREVVTLVTSGACRIHEGRGLVVGVTVDTDARPLMGCGFVSRDIIEMLNRRTMTGLTDASTRSIGKTGSGRAVRVTTSFGQHHPGVGSHPFAVRFMANQTGIAAAAAIGGGIMNSETGREMTGLAEG